MPTFGRTDVGDGHDADLDIDRIRGIIGAPAAGDGTADSISVRLKCATAGNKTGKCALYNHTTSVLVGETEEKAVAVTNAYQWFTWNFVAHPNVVNATNYVIVLFLDYDDAHTVLIDGIEGVDHYKDQAYNGFPDPIAFNHFTITVSIYCTYTVGGAAPSKKRMLMGVGLMAKTPKFTARKVVPWKCPLPLYK